MTTTKKYFSFAAVCQVLVFSASAIQAKEKECVAVGVPNRDILNVLCDGKQIKFRLDGIDCPEKKKPFGQKAKDFTADL